METTTYDEKIAAAIHTSFPQAHIRSVTKFGDGLTSSVYKVEIRNPDKILVVKFFPKKLESRVEKSIQISHYLREHGLPAPENYSLIKNDNAGMVVMGCSPGKVASDVWGSTSTEHQQTLLTNAGAILRKIHDIDIPPFWNHQKHEVASGEEWVVWTRLRTEKYIKAAKENLSKDNVDFIKKSFERLNELYVVHPGFRFAPLHWDYHLSNINVDEKWDVSGVFDFDNAMKGHDMADIGQAVYWLMVNQKVSKKELFESFFSGYGTLSPMDREFIYLHSILFLMAVVRSTWHKTHLTWLNEIHLEVLRGCIEGKYIL